MKNAMELTLCGSSKAILFLAHGGGDDALRYFDPGPKCQQCYGLPEDRTAVLEALRRGYAVIVVKSRGIRWEREDLLPVTKIIKEWTAEHSLEGLSLAVWGFSSGTYFASALPFSLPVRALVLMCGEGIFEVEEMATPELFPPTFFAYMPIDEDNPDLNTTGKDAEAMAILSERGVKVYNSVMAKAALTTVLYGAHSLHERRDVCESTEFSN